MQGQFLKNVFAKRIVCVYVLSHTRKEEILPTCLYLFYLYKKMKPENSKFFFFFLFEINKILHSSNDFYFQVVITILLLCQVSHHTFM